VDYRHLEIEKRDHIAIVTLDRPEKLNALNGRLMRELIHVSESFADDTRTRAVIFTGRGKHFCAGADLSGGVGNAGVSDDDDPDVSSRLALRRSQRFGPNMLRAIQEIDQITIAAVHGGALGGGACIVTACDFRIGAEGSFCGYPEVNLGMNLQWRAVPLCVRLIGPARAKRMIALGRKESAETLLDWGFYDELVPRDALMDAALKMAGDYAAQPPIPTQMIKQSVNAVAHALDAAVMHMDQDQWLMTAGTDDYREGVKAFFEKRAGEFEGN
jgi:enoyl-CoA hydratase